MSVEPSFPTGRDIARHFADYRFFYHQGKALTHKITDFSGDWRIIE